ncbi:MAG: hypothetical protein WCK89_12130 [bacterium]
MSARRLSSIRPVNHRLETCRVGEGTTAVRFTRDTEPDAYQSRVFELLKPDAPAWPSKRAQ